MAVSKSENTNYRKNSGRTAAAAGERINVPGTISAIMISTAVIAVISYVVLAIVNIEPVDHEAAAKIIAMQADQAESGGLPGGVDDAAPVTAVLPDTSGPSDSVSETDDEPAGMPTQDAGLLTQPSTVSPETVTAETPSETASAETASETVPSETTPPETAPQETPAETAPPETVPADPRAIAEAQAAANAEKALNTWVHSLSQEEIDAIRGAFDNTVKGFGIGLGQKTMDAYNRPQQAVNIENELNTVGANPRVFCSDPGTKTVAFSFQAGYEGGYTNQILDILDSYGVKGTFYITHYFANQAQDIVRRMILGNHEIGSHSYACPDQGIAYSSLEEQMNDALRMQTYMQNTFAYNMRKYNYNSGAWSQASAVMMAQMGYEVCFCSVNYEDFDRNRDFNADEVLADMQSKLHPGCVYCFHMTNPVTVRILPGLIEYCRSMGYTIVQLD